jgi:hypothetical protein
VLASIESSGGALRLDAKAERALLNSSTRGGRTSISLIDLKGAPETAPVTVLVTDGINPAARFLADGSIAATTNAHDGGMVRIYSAAGRQLMELPQPGSALISGEMFPGVLAVTLAGPGIENLGLIEIATGATVRRIPGVFSPLALSASTPPPGTPAARLLQSRDGRLYELPTITAEPRLLLPISRP